MLFNSFRFLLFFVVVFFAYWALPHRFRWILLLVGSYYFYMCWRAEYALLLLFSTVVTYTAGLLIDREKKRGRSGAVFVWLNAAICFGLLIYFKYLNFLCQSIVGITEMLSFLPSIQIPIWDIVLPVGISFQLFQAVGYTTDIYRGEVPVEKHFGYYALFVSFFPQLVAGPIERTKNLLPQLRAVHTFRYENGVDGMRQILMGLFKKVAVADTLAVFVDRVYNNVGEFTGLPLVLATVLFTFQIFCDFSGYSDIASGCALMLDIRLMTNFKSPYLAQSIQEFWRRWHISLSTWFRDNVYFPLGGNRVSPGRHLRNLMITFVLSGIWHGAGWNFMIWGGIHGLYLCGETIMSRKLPHNKSRKRGIYAQAVRIICVFTLVCFAWLFFRANSFSDAVYVMQNMFTGIQFNLPYLKQSCVAMGFSRISLVFSLILPVILFLVDLANNTGSFSQWVGKQTGLVRWGIYIGLSVVILCGIMFTSRSQNFIYFQF